MNRKTTVSLMQVAGGAVGVALVVLAFLRGNFLFGFECGVFYAMFFGGLVWFFIRSLAFAKKRSVVRALAILVLSVPIGYVLAYPASINPDVEFVIADQADDRAARAELKKVFATDPAFAHLSISTVHLKKINITISGSLPSLVDLERLSERIAQECPTVQRCLIHWNVTLRDTKRRIDESDRELFRDKRKT